MTVQSIDLYVQAGTHVDLHVPPPQVTEVRVGGARGRPGQPGATGEQGPSAGGATKHFAVATDTWEFDHDVGYPPAVVTYGSDGLEIGGGRIVENTSIRTVVTWYMPVSGSMTVS